MTVPETREPFDLFAAFAPTARPLAYWVKLAATVEQDGPKCSECGDSGEDAMGRICLCVAFERDMDYSEPYDR